MPAVGRIALLPLLALAALPLGGCAAVGLTLLSVAAGVGGGAGVSHTLDGIAYKTFATPLDELEQATLVMLTRMDVAVRSNETTDAGRQLVGDAGGRTVDIELERLTGRTSRMRVTVKKNWLLRDRATAMEMITQTDQALVDAPRVTRKPAAAKPPAAAARRANGKP